MFVCPVNCHHYCVRWNCYVNHMNLCRKSRSALNTYTSVNSPKLMREDLAAKRQYNRTSCSFRVSRSKLTILSFSSSRSSIPRQRALQLTTDRLGRVKQIIDMWRKRKIQGSSEQSKRRLQQRSVRHVWSHSGYLTIRPVACKGYGLIAHEVKPNGLLTRGPWGRRV